MKTNLFHRDSIFYKITEEDPFIFQFFKFTLNKKMYSIESFFYLKPLFIDRNITKH